MADKEVVLNQSDNLGFNVQIKLIDGRELQVLKIGNKTEQRYSIDILALQNKSKRVFFIAWKWLFASVSIFFSTLILLKILPPYLAENQNLILAIVLFSGFIGTIFSLIKFWKHTSRKQVFHSHIAHVPIIAFNIGKPSKKAFAYFINSIEKRIEKFRQHMDVSDDKQLSGEMKMLRRLADQGIIKKAAYGKAKAKLFSEFDSSVVVRKKAN